MAGRGMTPWLTREYGIWRDRLKFEWVCHRGTARQFDIRGARRIRFGTSAKPSEHTVTLHVAEDQTQAKREGARGDHKLLYDEFGFWLGPGTHHIWCEGEW